MPSKGESWLSNNVFVDVIYSWITPSSGCKKDIKKDDIKEDGE